MGINEYFLLLASAKALKMTCACTGINTKVLYKTSIDFPRIKKYLIMKPNEYKMLIEMYL